MKDISKSIAKVDHEEKVSGSSIYVNDIQMKNMLYAKTVRSMFAKAKIVNIKIPSLPRDYFIVDYKDIPGPNFVKMIFEDWPIFAENSVNYIGEPILLVIGKNKIVIDKIIENIKIEYKVLKPEFDYKNSVINKQFQKGNAKKAFSNAVKKFSETYEMGYQEQAYIEPQGFIAYLDEDKVTLIGSMQCLYYIKNAVVNALACDDNKVRVIQPAVGGAFGGKEEFPSLMACQLAVAVNKIKKPIKMIYEREEDMLVTTKRHPTKVELVAAVDKDNYITGFKADVSLDSGAYIGLSGVVLSRAMINATSAYTIDNLDISGNVFATNTVPNGAFRGFGAPQMIFAIDMLISDIARQLKIDPLEFRLKHLAKQNDLTSTSGVFRDPIIMNKMIEKVVKESKYHEKTEKYNNIKTYKGIGMSLFLHGCGFTGSGESTHINALVKLRKDINDHIYVLVAAVDMGQGAKTTLAKIVAQTIGCKNDKVSFDNPDTDFVPDSGPTVASRTIMIVGALLARAAKKMKDTWIESQEIEIMERYKQPHYIKWDEEKMIGDAYPAYSWGVNIVEVEVSPITYQVKLKGIWSAYDIGKAIDKRMVLGQADGGITQGVAYGYLEVMKHKNGMLQHKNLTDYIIPTSMDVPKMKTYLFENPFVFGPYGAKGVGELTLVGGAPAVVLAIEQAINKKITKIPATPEYLMELIDNE